jgi:hypothetical protein
MLIRDWLFIDGTMDNHVQSAVDGAVPDTIDEDDERAGDTPTDRDTETDQAISRLPRVAQVGLSIRRAGWDQIPDWPHDVAGFTTWPAPGQMATVTLTRAQWKLIVFALRHWADVDERIADAENAATSRAIATAVEQRLVEQAGSPETP